MGEGWWCLLLGGRDQSLDGVEDNAQAGVRVDQSWVERSMIRGQDGSELGGTEFRTGSGWIRAGWNGVLT